VAGVALSGSGPGFFVTDASDATHFLLLMGSARGGFFLVLENYHKHARKCMYEHKRKIDHG
jgi:hypothetical protein